MVFWQMKPAGLWVKNIWVGVVLLITIFPPLSLPVIATLELTTRTRYPVPGITLHGIVQFIVPFGFKEGKVPMIVGLLKFPEASDNSAVKMFPAPNVALEL